MRAALCALLALALLFGCRPPYAPVPPSSASSHESPAEEPSRPQAVDPDAPYVARMDRDDLTSCATVIAAGRWWESMGWASNHDDVHISDVDISAVDRDDNRLVPQKTVFIVLAKVRTSWWKLDSDVLMLMKPVYTFEHTREDLFAWQPLVVYDGEDLTWEVVNLGTGEAHHALMVQEHPMWNGGQATVTHIYLHTGDPDYGLVREVFREVTSYRHVPWGGAMWSDTEITFRDHEAEMKEIVVNTHVEKWHGDPIVFEDDPAAEEEYYKILDERQEWFWTWDGEAYRGAVELPHGENLPSSLL